MQKGNIRRKAGIVLGVLILCGMTAGIQMLGDWLLRSADRTEEAEETAAQAEKEVEGQKDAAVIVVDSGHGGSDPGKVGINGALEKDVNLSISKKLQKCLETEGYQVIMTREDENGLADSKVEDMKTRVTLINEKKPLLAVSIHQNSYGQESIHGAQVFYYTHSGEGEKAAKVMQEALLGADPDNTRQAKANDTYYLLKRTEVPAIIVECGFLSNKEEADRLNTEEYQQKLAEAITQGIRTYAEENKKQE